MDADTFDEGEFFRAIATSGARALLIGRRALIALGLPVLTADYDFWLHIDDVEILNTALERLDMIPTRTSVEARLRGRYVIENGEHVDVITAREFRSVEGENLSFELSWSRRMFVQIHGVTVAVPTVDDLIAMKTLASRPKDLEDIRLLRALHPRGAS
jgi:hypothetical protein